MWMTSRAVHDNQFEEERTVPIKEEMTFIIKEEGKWGERQPWARLRHGRMKRLPRS
jgi:hypothetical protein